MSVKNEVCWGVIGVGDVVLRKSGGPLQSLPDSKWISLCRRDINAAREMAARFSVGQVFTDAGELLSDNSINAVYVATPPSTHASFAIAALEAGKDVYLEKPIALSTAEALEIKKAVEQSGRKLVMAHYRRALPAFEAIGKMLGTGRIGTPLFSRIRIIQPLPGVAAGSNLVAADIPDFWRLRPEISGGGLFHDLAPHQLDLCLDWFGDIKTVSGISRRLGYNNDNAADNYVSGQLEFNSGMLLDGLWCFGADDTGRAADEFSVYGTDGRITFSFFGEEVTVETGKKTETLSFLLPEWLQEPMLARTIDYFLDRCENPCSVEYGVKTMEIIDALTGNS